MNHAYRIYMFVLLLGLCCRMTASQGGSLGRRTCPSQEEVPQIEFTEKQPDPFFEARASFEILNPLDHNQARTSFVNLTETMAARSEQQSHRVPRKRTADKVEELMQTEPMDEGDGDAENMALMQRGQQKRRRSSSPRRRRQKPHGRDGREGRGHKEDSCGDDEWEWDEEARRYYRKQWKPREGERTATSSWARIPPWANRRSEPASGSRQTARSPPRTSKAPPATPRGADRDQSQRTKFVSLVPTLEQLGPGVRMWSDAVGVTGEHEDFTGQDRHLLSDTAVFSLAKDLASMTHAQRVNAYCDLIRFLGVLFADLMRAMTRAEEIADEEVLLQVSTEGPQPSVAPHLAGRVSSLLEVEDAIGENRKELDKEADQEAWVDVELEVNESEMVDGWWDADMAPTADPNEPKEDNDTCSHMQVAAKVGPTTVFASYLARLQAHFESMTKPQRESIIDYLHRKLNAWRNKWVMSLTSVSRDRADRLWALLVTYQGEETCILTNDAKWAEARWAEVVDMLQIDAVRAANIEDFLLQPPRSGSVVVDDTQQEGQGERASASEDVVVRRNMGDDWERATELEKEELARHEADLREEEARQAAHDEHVWATHQAMRAREWDEWAIRAEMDNSTRTRPLKRFRVRVAVKDAERNELATADLTGEVEPNDTPQITITMQEEIAQVASAEDQSERGKDERGKEEKQEDKRAGNEDEDQEDADQAETIAVASMGDVEAVDEEIDPDISHLGDIMESVMGRQWFQLFVDRQVDSDMVRKRWGAAALEIFQVNRDMMELMEAVEENKGKSAAERMRVDSQHEGDLVVRTMDSGNSSSQSTGVAGTEGEKVNNAEEHGGATHAAGEADDMENEDRIHDNVAAENDAEGCAGADREKGSQTDGTLQQELQNTQLEEMDVEEVGAAGATGASSSTAGSGTSLITGSSEGLGDGSYGDGKIQADLEGWLRREH